MNRTLFFLFLFFLSFPLKGENYNLAIGQSIRLSTHPMEKLYFQKKGLLSLKDLGSEIVLTGKKLGETQLVMGRKKYHIRILKKNLFESLKQLEKWLEGKRGPEILVSNKQISVGGRLLSFYDFKDLQKFTTEDSDFRITARIPKQTQKQIEDYTTKILNQNNFPKGTLSFRPYLHLRIGKQKQKGRYKKIFHPLGIKVVFDPDGLIQVPVVKIKIYIAHLKKSFLRKWGVQWPVNLSVSQLPEAVKPDLFILSLQNLETGGFGKILASPNLVIESGKTGMFHSGGEFPMVTSTQFNNSVKWKPYGLFLKTTPKANAKKNLKVKVDLELSSIDESFSIGGIPALNRSHFKTEISMKTPKPIILSGFSRQDMGKSNQGLPWLGQIPLFKSLFSTGQIHNSQMDLAFILVPDFYEQ